MSLEIRRAPPTAGIVADRRLYLAGDQLVEDGDPSAAYLLATPGWVISAEDCARLKLSLKDGKVVQEVEAKPAEKPKRKKGV